MLATSSAVIAPSVPSPYTIATSPICGFSTLDKSTINWSIHTFPKIGHFTPFTTTYPLFDNNLEYPSAYPNGIVPTTTGLSARYKCPYPTPSPASIVFTFATFAFNVTQILNLYFSVSTSSEG